eukprot:11945590-Ditylum_brightwellii.AAC.1
MEDQKLKSSFVSSASEEASKVSFDDCIASTSDFYSLSNSSNKEKSSKQEKEKQEIIIFI